MEKPRQLFKVRPRHEWVLVRKLSLDEEVTGAGLVINKDQRKTFHGVVVDMGWKVKHLAIGDTVLFSAFAMKNGDLEEMTGDKNLLMVRDEEVYNTVEPVEA